MWRSKKYVERVRMVPSCAGTDPYNSSIKFNRTTVVCNNNDTEDASEILAREATNRLIPCTKN